VTRLNRQPTIALLGPEADAPFPPVSQALREPDGLLAMGGDLAPQRLLAAYRLGIFPWYSEGQPLLWWSPDPRAVFATDGVRLPSKFRRQLRRSRWSVAADTAFEQVIDACANSPRPGQQGTWITACMRDAYLELHRLGHAHSVEVFDDDARLVGGVYGIAIGRMFFGESMFSHESGASKLALAALARCLNTWGWPWIDAQVGNAHTASLGCIEMARIDFCELVARWTREPDATGVWTERFGLLRAPELA
jgi:leucyl/phenylalanyl-tRNA--protein transferase